MTYSKKQDNPLTIKESGWTVEDYYKLPEDGNQYEIINGVLELKSSPTTTHQRISQQIFDILGDSCKDAYIIMYAPVDVSGILDCRSAKCHNRAIRLDKAK